MVRPLPRQCAARRPRRSARLKALTGQVPTLAAVLVGENPASQTYVGAKGKACEEAGMGSITHRLPATATQAEVEDLVRALNADPAVNGILVQLPLPKGLNEQAVLDLISLNKDVDGFHPMNIGQLVMKGRTPQFIPCTPAGCIELLVRCGIPIAGKTRWSWAAATSSACRWRPCCRTPTPP